ncbi:hypothetical protein EVAR_75692_1 [Eumeta japonica]|uniref:Uncharacterized protein n=1 Tax=Eumeta variegata TaxID=151549 RepID=A0A4C1W3T1_EUMVA|nr:hypothetical protein EVAR_75692_1 [Eumeta japonica]
MSDDKTLNEDTEIAATFETFFTDIPVLTTSSLNSSRALAESLLRNNSPICDINLEFKFKQETTSLWSNRPGTRPLKSYLNNRVQRMFMIVLFADDISLLFKVKRQQPTYDDVNNAISKPFSLSILISNAARSTNVSSDSIVRSDSGPAIPMAVFSNFGLFFTFDARAVVVTRDAAECGKERDPFKRKKRDYSDKDPEEKDIPQALSGRRETVEKAKIHLTDDET